MSASTRLPDVIDALVSIFNANSLNAVVYDGQGVSSDEPQLYALVGVESPDGTSGAQSGDTDQTWAYVGAQALGRRQRDEHVSVNCGIVSWDGGDDQKAVRDSAFALLDCLTDAIEDDPTLGGIVLFVSEVSGVRLIQSASESGVSAVITFTVKAQARTSRPQL